MRKNILALVAVSVTAATPAAAECVDIIRASALKGTVVEGASSIDAEARMFCSEYASAKSSGKSLSVSGSYTGIGIGVGSSSSNVEQVASKYCDAANGYRAKSSSYSQYVETIAPGAFAAYSDCLKSNGSITADLPVTAIHAKDLAIIVSNRSGVVAPQQVNFTASPGFDCAWLWDGADVKGRQISLPNSGNTTLQCKRNDQATEGSISVVAQSALNGNYTFLWKRYQDGLPVDELQAIKNANLELSAALSSAVLVFDAQQCPNGFAPIQKLAGRFVLGAGSGNGLTARTYGAIGGEEEHQITVDEMPSHTHEYTYTSHQHTPVKGDPSGDEFGKIKAGEKTSSAGGDKAHNNMPPFAVMQFCRRS